MAGGARRALVVGVDRYDDPGLTRLRSPAADVEALAEVLGDPVIGGFTVTRSYNPTEGELTRAVDAFFGEAVPDDLLLLHLSCHGVKDASGDLYFAATDTRLSLLRSTGVASSFVSAALRHSRARRGLLLLDCCYSGAFDPGTVHRGGEDVDLQSRFADTGTGRGRAVLTASSAMEYAFEGGDLTETTEATASSTSVFTTAVVEGLRTGEADRDQDGQVDLDELYEYTLERVRGSTSRQTPHLWVYGLQGRLAVARRASPVTVPVPLPAEVQMALDNPLASVRRSVVPHLSALSSGAHLGIALSARRALDDLTDDDSSLVRASAAEALAALEPAPSRPDAARPRDPADRRPPELPHGPVVPEEDGAPRPEGWERRPGDGDRPRPATGPPWYRRPTRVTAAVVATALAAVALVWLPDAVDGWRSGDGATPGGAAGDPPPLEWAGAAPPTDREQGVLDQITRVFADTGSCRGVPDPDVDPRDVFPSGADNIECRYPGGATTVFSRFGSDAAMHDFFDARLASRGLTVPVPDLSARWPWHVRLEGPPSGRAFGNVNLTRPVDDERVELGLVRDGTATYAYTYAPGEDFETVYEWWYATFLHLS